MLPDSGSNEKQEFINTLLRVLGVVFLIAATIYVIYPFAGMLVWAGVLAIALYPVQEWFQKKVGIRSGWSATWIILALFTLLVAPCTWLLMSTAGGIADYLGKLNAASLVLPFPSEEVKNWPLIGQSVFDFWNKAASDLPAFLSLYEKQISFMLMKTAGIAGGVAADVAYFMLALIIAGFFLANGSTLMVFTHKFLSRLTDDKADEISGIITGTIRNVVKGVLVIALVQTILAGVSFVITGIPFPGMWTAFCLLLSVVQIGILPVALVLIIYVWIKMSTLTAILFMVWMLFIGIIDNIIRPALMGKASKAPAGVVFLGSMGGLLSMGFIGLFIGAILLSVVYELINAWTIQRNR